VIKFPTVHIATSVVNRILNLADGIPDQAPATGSRRPLAPIPSTMNQSVALDKRLAQGTPDVGTVENSPDPGGTVSGRPLLDTFLTPGR
jgi:hypothetical protein